MVWLRRAAPEELRLERDQAPALRDLARRGMSVTPIVIEDLDRLVREIRSGSSAALGRSFREIGAPPRSPAERGTSDTLAKLRERFGTPPVENPGGDGNREVAESLARLRKPTGDALAESAAAWVGGGFRLVFFVDPESPADVAERKQRDETVDGLQRRLLVEPWASTRIVVVILVDDEGNGALIAAGADLPRGVVAKESLNSVDVAQLLGVFARIPEASPPHALRDVLESFRSRDARDDAAESVGDSPR